MMRDNIVAWAVVFVEHGLLLNIYLEKFEADAVCEAVNSDKSGDIPYSECKVIPLCEYIED